MGKTASQEVIFIVVYYNLKGNTMKEQFILASASPRRSELLKSIGLDFEVIVSEADESMINPDEVAPDLYVQELALIKAAATAKKVIRNKKAVIISADTVVTADGAILGKPRDEHDAFNMLSMLSGRGHEVYTGFCVMRIRDGKAVCRSVKTEVYFKELTADKICRYVDSGEPMDKAGAYGIQGLGGIFVDRIIGDYQNVVGLSVSALADVLENEFEINIIK